MPHIRIATLSDVETLCQIGARTFIETYGEQNTPENLQNYLEKRFNEKQISDEIQTPETVFLLVELNNETIGYARLRVNLIENPDPKALEIERIYILKAFHGQKLGTVLMQKCIDISLEKGYQSLWLGVWEYNPKAIAFYQKWGFEIFGTHIFQLGDDAQTDYLMKKKLTEANNLKMMNIRNATREDIEGVLMLQAKYLLANTPDDERENGFVTTPFTVEQIENIIAQDGLFIAENENKVVAYAFAGSWEYFSQWAIFPFMAIRLSNYGLENKEVTTENSFQYGPICIDADYRGSGLFQQLFEAMRIAMQKRYPIGITFINKINKRSYEAHTKKLEMKVVDEFTFNNNDFYGLRFDTSVSVLD